MNMQATRVSVNPTRAQACALPGKPCFDTLPYQIALAYESHVWRYIEELGGIERYVIGWNRAGRDTPPSVQMPVNGQRLDEVGSIALPANNGVDTVVLRYRVPRGYRGVILSLVNDWTGTTFVDGSGDLTWRLQINQAWVKTYGNIRYQYGNLQNRYPLEGAYIQLVAGDVVTYYVNHAVASALTGGFIITGIGGYIYPAD
jgi:hypothetical protein